MHPNLTLLSNQQDNAKDKKEDTIVKEMNRK